MDLTKTVKELDCLEIATPKIISDTKMRCFLQKGDKSTNTPVIIQIPFDKTSSAINNIIEFYIAPFTNPKVEYKVKCPVTLKIMKPCRNDEK